MPEQNPDHNLVNMVVDYISHLLNAPLVKNEEELPEALSGIPHLEEMCTLVVSIRHLVVALSKGDLEYSCKERGFIAGALKAFQSNLRHLTWQAGRIAAGEYHHRVNFMGDFSVAFNKMTEQLNSTINSLTSLSEQYKDLSYHDPLTGYYNRMGFSKHAVSVLENGSVPRRASMIMTDIDHFKRVNDTYGHPCGDAVLKAFSGKLQSLLRSQELCCRYGGEEFIIFMPNTPIETGLAIAKRLRAAVEAMVIEFEGKSLQITASFGIIGVEDMPPGMGAEDFLAHCIQKTDILLYEAKTGGRNRVVGPKTENSIESSQDQTPQEDMDSAPAATESNELFEQYFSADHSPAKPEEGDISQTALTPLEKFSGVSGATPDPALNPQEPHLFAESVQALALMPLERFVNWTSAAPQEALASTLDQESAETENSSLFMPLKRFYTLGEPEFAVRTDFVQEILIEEPAPDLVSLLEASPFTPLKRVFRAEKNRDSALVQE